MEENDPGMIGDIVFHLRTQFIIGPGRHAVCLLHYKSWATGLLRESGNRASQKKGMQTNDSSNLEGSGNLPGLGGGMSGGLSPSVHTFRFILKQSSRISVSIDGVEHIRSHFYLNN